MKVLLGIVPIVALIGLIEFGGKSTERQLVISGGRSTISLFPSLLASEGLKAVYKATAEGDSTTAEQTQGFRIISSDLKYRLSDGRLSQFDGGTISHSGGFTLTSKTGKIDAIGFIVTQSPTTSEELQLQVNSGKEIYPLFNLVHPRSTYLPKLRQVAISYMDCEFTLEGAQHLGRPDLAGKFIGTLSVYGASKPIDGGGDIVETQNRDTGGTGGPDAGIDVSLSAMGSLSVAGHTGTFGSGLTGMTMSTTSCNVGTVNIPWAAPMQNQHPGIAMNLYRILNGRLEQIGWSWMKHGFFATNSSGCGSCQNPGTGALLGPGCSDTYGTGNNSDQFYLGGRDEWNAFTGTWTCQNSYFSNYINDCTRRNTGSGLDAVAHRLVVPDADLGNAGAQYIYEAYYVNANDIDHYNQIGSRTATINASGSTWSISTTGAQVQGPTINRWGEMRSFATPRSEGDAIVAVQTTNLGNGMWHYEYAVYNHDMDRQVRQFSIPVPVGMNVQNVGFRDIDQDANNQWTSTYSNGAITWSTGTFGSSSANPLKFGSLFNFRFDVNLAPTNGNSAMEYFKSGTNPSLVAATKVPMNLSAPDTIETIRCASTGTLSIGALAQSDDVRVQLFRLGGGTTEGSGLLANYTAATSNISNIVIQVEANIAMGISLQIPTQQIELFNYSTGQWELVDSRQATTSDSITNVTINSNASRFVNSAGLIQARILDFAAIGGPNQWRMNIDRVGFLAN